MQRRPSRLRWWIRIVLLTVLLAIGTTLTWSRLEPVQANQHFMSAWFGGAYSAYVDLAVMRIENSGHPPAGRFVGFVSALPPPERWGPVTFERTLFGGWSLEVSLKVPFVLLGAIAALAWLPPRRARAGRCPKCGYSLKNLPESAPCPECGTKPEPSTRP